MEKQRYFILFIFLLFSFNNNLYTATFTQVQKFVSNDIQDNDAFGNSIVIEGNYAVIGCMGEDGAGTNRGAVYVFYLTDSNTWTQIAKLTASDASDGDWLGLTVAIDNDVIVSTAYFENAGGTESGSVYLYVKPPGGWTNMTQTAKLTATDLSASDYFGFSQIDIQNDVVVIGSYANDEGGINNSGTAYVFVKPPGGWVNMTETARLTVSDKAAEDLFGQSVSLDNDVIVVGARKVDNGGFNRGAVYVYVKPPGGWVNMTETAKLTASDGQDSDEFGVPLRILGDIIVAASYYEDGVGINRGALYLFEKPPGGWVNMTETAKLTASDGQDNDQLGDLTLEKDIVISGAWSAAGGGIDRGAAYIFRKPLNGWTDMNENYKIIPSDSQDNDFFGGGIFMKGNKLLINSRGHNGGGVDRGAVYYFAVTPEIYSLNSNELSSSSRRVEALVNDNNSSSTISFIYGKNSNQYIDTVLASNSPLAQYSSTTTIFVNLTNLTSSGTYYYRALAWNDYDTSISNESYFVIADEVNQSTDTDGDGVSDLIENASPNSGDGNGDGIQDALQTNVTSMLNSISGYYQTIVSNAGILLSDIEEVETESNSKYNFPFGAIKFKLNSSATTIKILYHGISKLSNYIYRKKRFGDEWFNFSNVVFGSENINGLVTAKVELTLKDGSDEDYDGMKNGFIIDPGGPAILIEDNIPFWNYWMLILTILVVIYLYHKYKTNESRKRLI